MTKKFTYLLGAGASCKAIPMVKHLRDRLIFQAKRFEKEEKLSSYVQLLNWLSQEIINYPSIDTFAKFLYLKVDERVQDYIGLKNALTLFLIVEQYYNWGRTDFLNDEKNEFPDNLDPRHLSFLISLFEEKKWPSNVKILTWNYDYQLEIAAKKIGGNLVGSWPRKGLNELTNETNIIHLNGIAHISKDSELLKNSM